MASLVSIIFYCSQLLSLLALLSSVLFVGLGVCHSIVKKQPWYITVVVSLSVGLSAFIVMLDVFVHFFGSSGYYVIFIWLLLSIILAIRHRPKVTSLILCGGRSIYSHKWLLLITLVSSLSMWLGIALSGLNTREGMVFQPGIMRDSLWHLALIKSLLRSNPPIHPSDSTLLLTNYHYFYDLVIAAWYQATHIDISSLYFRWSALFTTLMLVFSSLVLVRVMVTKYFSLFGALTVLFLCWGGSLAFLIPVFLPGQPWGESSFWVSQTFVMLVNPQLLLSFAVLIGLMLMGLVGVTQKVSGKNFYLWLGLLLLLLYATAGLKFFGVIFGFLIVTIFLTWYWFRSQQRIRHFFVLIMFICFCAALIAFRFVDLSTKQMVFSPLWFVSSMIASPDRVYVEDWLFREQHYRDVNSWHYLVLLKVVETAIFYLGNLGMRVIGVGFFIPLLLERRKKQPLFQNQWIPLVLCGLALISSSIPLFFIQNGIVWNSIQFWYYTLFFINFLAALTLGYFVVMLKHRPLQAVVIIGVIGASSILFGKHLARQLREQEFIPAADIAATQSMSKFDTVFVCPEGKLSSLYYDSSFVSFFSDAKVILVDPLMLEVVGSGGYTRTSQLKDVIIHDDLYSYIHSQQHPQITKVLCDPEMLMRRKNNVGPIIFRNKNIVVVQVNADCRTTNQCARY